MFVSGGGVFNACALDALGIVPSGSGPQNARFQRPVIVACVRKLGILALHYQGKSHLGSYAT
jgi:hypothetical protein